MFDIIIIQHAETGIVLAEYSAPQTAIDEEHSDLFSGFLSAVQGVTKEINIGQLCQVSTEGEKGHHCLICSRGPINVIILIDQDDNIDFWRNRCLEIAQDFLKEYSESFNSSKVSQFKGFNIILKNMCSEGYCEDSDTIEK